MSDNAASHDSVNTEVHPETRAGADGNQPNEIKDDTAGATEESKEEGQTRDVMQASVNEQADPVSAPRPPSASPPPAPPSALPPSPPPTSTSKEAESALFPTNVEEPTIDPVQDQGNEATTQSQEPLFMGTTETADTAEEGEGLDPDTLASIAALSRLQGDDDEDGDEEISGGDHDFSSLAVDSQHMTREQMHDLVARLAQGDDEDAEGEDDPDADAEGEDEAPGDGQDDGDGAQHKREDSEDLREVDESRREAKDESDGSKAGRRKRKRNRTVL
jgi:hypothetical protein